MAFGFFSKETPVGTFTTSGKQAYTTGFTSPITALIRQVEMKFNACPSEEAGQTTKRRQLSPRTKFALSLKERSERLAKLERVVPLGIG
jgi:hypothetical protein